MKTYRDFLSSRVFAVLFYLILVFVLNVNLLTGQTLMKWDIMDMHYPLCMSTADTIRSGALPLWNAALHFGNPTYSILGTPFWYPTTLFFEWIFGYSLWCVGAEYCLHLVLACFGMYLFTREYMTQHVSNPIYKQLLALICGLFYGFSGLFISNAQHIMIWISAAWLPYSLLYAKRYTASAKYKDCFFTSLFIGLSIIGGYPELWVNTFIVLIPFVFYLTPKPGKTKVLQAAAKYLQICFGAFLAAGISAIPFLFNSRYVERLSKAQVPVSYSLKHIQSAFMAHYSEHDFSHVRSLDVSMISMYMGVIVFFLFVFGFLYKCKGLIFEYAICLFAFAMMMGDRFFIHPIFAQYFPMYKSLRFPTVWRCVLAVFAILIAAKLFVEICEGDKKRRPFRIFLTFLTVMFVLLYVKTFFDNNVPAVSLLNLRKDLLVLFSVLFGYAALLYFWNTDNKRRRVIITGLMLLSICEVGYFFKTLYPLTVVIDGTFGEGMDQAVLEAYEEDRERTHSTEYRDSVRTRSGLNSTSVVFRHTLDEEGYLTFKLNHVQKYQASLRRNINEELPEVYFTSNVCIDTPERLDDWLQNITYEPDCIFISTSDTSLKMAEDERGKSNKNKETDTSRYQVSVRDRVPLDVTSDSKGVFVVNIPEGMYSVGDTKRVRIYLQESNRENDNVFLDKISFFINDKAYEFEDQTYAYNTDHEKNCFDVRFPIYEEIDKICIEGGENLNVVGAELLKTESFPNQGIIIDSLQPGSVLIKSDLDEDGYLVVLQSYHHGWQLFVDGERRPVTKISNTFIGTYLTKGSHTVEYRFRPLDFYVGLGVSIIYILGSVVVICFQGKRKLCKHVA